MAATAGDEAGLAAAESLADLRAEAGTAGGTSEGTAGRTGYGDGALIACDRVVRIYAAEGVEVQACRAWTCWWPTASSLRSWGPPAAGSQH